MKIENRQRKLAELLGINLDEIAPTVHKTKKDKSHEAEAVVRFVQAPKLFTLRVCLLEGCHKEFAYAWGSVAYCSDRCRQAHLKSIGIDWNPNKSQHERWGLRLPLIVPPDALAALKEMLSESLVSPGQ